MDISWEELGLLISMLKDQSVSAPFDSIYMMMKRNNTLPSKRIEIFLGQYLFPSPRQYYLSLCDKPLEEMPLHLNNYKKYETGYSLIRWRLKIGR